MNDRIFKSYLKYPFHSIINEYPDARKQNLITHMVTKWQRAIIAFYAPKANSDKAYDMIGSGFLINIKGAYAIVTANHVMEHLQQNNCYFYLNNKLFPLTKTYMMRNQLRDYAFIMPTEEIFSHEKKFIYFDDAFCQDLEPTSSVIISGYPSTKNSIHVDRPNKGQQLYSILFNYFEYDRDSEDLCFPFDSKPKMICPEMFEPLSHSKSLPFLNGMSGSPVMQIMKNTNTSALSLRVIGIFKEHHKKKKQQLVASAFDSFSKELIML